MVSVSGVALFVVCVDGYCVSCMVRWPEALKVHFRQEQLHFEISSFPPIAFGISLMFGCGSVPDQ